MPFPLALPSLGVELQNLQAFLHTFLRLLHAVSILDLITKDLWAGDTYR